MVRAALKHRSLAVACGVAVSETGGTPVLDSSDTGVPALDDTIARELNGRPRQTLAWRTPYEVFAQTVATTD
jgi:hypothetical protein